MLSRIASILILVHALRLHVIFILWLAMYMVQSINRPLWALRLRWHAFCPLRLISLFQVFPWQFETVKLMQSQPSRWLCCWCYRSFLLFRSVALHNLGLKISARECQFVSSRPDVAWDLRQQLQVLKKKLDTSLCLKWIFISSNYLFPIPGIKVFWCDRISWLRAS